jgi:predicted nucleotidyltransferase
MMRTQLGIDETTLARFCAKNHIRRLALFGSTLRGQDRPDSDVDLLVEFDPEHVPGLFALADMEAEQGILSGGGLGNTGEVGECMWPPESKNAPRPKCTGDCPLSTWPTFQVAFSDFGGHSGTEFQVGATAASAQNALH